MVAAAAAAAAGGGGKVDLAMYNVRTTRSTMLINGRSCLSTDGRTDGRHVAITTSDDRLQPSRPAGGQQLPLKCVRWLSGQ